MMILAYTQSKGSDGNVVLLILYVHDVMLVVKSKDGQLSPKKMMHQNFYMRDLGGIKFFYMCISHKIRKLRILLYFKVSPKFSSISILEGPTSQYHMYHMYFRNHGCNLLLRNTCLMFRT